MEGFYQKLSIYNEYFENIRKRVYQITIVFVVFFLIGFFNAGKALKAIIIFFNLEDASIVTTSPFQFLDLATKIGVYTGLIICLPVLIYHVYDFLKDGLSKKEKKLFFVLLPISVVLFLIGFFYCFTILYFYLKSVSFINLSFGIKNVWDVSVFLSQIIFSSVVFGIIFQYPIVLTFLIRTGLININSLIKNKLYVICGIFIFVGFLPPPDIFSTFIQVIPLILIYQITIWANSVNPKLKKREVSRGLPTRDVINVEVADFVEREKKIHEK